MTLIISRGCNGVSDPDAAAYVAAVEAADGQLLENAVGKAINAFVIGCKNDGIWNAIKASCILAGARTLNGALVPLVGTAPTNFNFVAGDYNRKTGLVGNGSTKYLNSNRNNNADPQNSNHNACFVSFSPSASRLMGSGANETGVNNLIFDAPGTRVRNRSTGAFTVNPSNASIAGLFGANRSGSSLVAVRLNGLTISSSTYSSEPPNSGPVLVFNSGGNYSNARLAFYSIGESLDLTLLDARVTALINALSAAIP